MSVGLTKEQSITICSLTILCINPIEESGNSGQVWKWKYCTSILRVLVRLEGPRFNALVPDLFTVRDRPKAMCSSKVGTTCW